MPDQNTKSQNDSDEQSSQSLNNSSLNSSETPTSETHESKLIKLDFDQKIYKKKRYKIIDLRFEEDKDESFLAKIFSKCIK